MTTAMVSAINTGRGPYVIDAVGQHGPYHLEGTITGPDEWVALRAALCASNRAMEYGADSGPNAASDDEAREAAAVAVTIWALETGWGAGEWNHNIGNVHCTASTVDCVRLTTRGGGHENIVAWDSIVEGIAEWWGLIDRRYARSMQQFQAGDLLAWNTLRTTGYGGSSVTADEAILIYRRVRRVLGMSAPTPAYEARVRAGWDRPTTTPGTTTRPETTRPETTRPETTPRSGSSSSSSSGVGLLLLGLVLSYAASKGR